MTCSIASSTSTLLVSCPETDPLPTSEHPLFVGQDSVLRGGKHTWATLVVFTFDNEALCNQYQSGWEELGADIFRETTSTHAERACTPWFTSGRSVHQRPSGSTIQRTKCMSGKANRQTATGLLIPPYHVRHVAPTTLGQSGTMGAVREGELTDEKSMHLTREPAR